MYSGTPKMDSGTLSRYGSHDYIPFKYIHCCIKIVLEWTTAPALANTTMMSGTAVFHSAQCVTITTTASIECSTEKGSKTASYKSQGVAQLEILVSVVTTIQ